MIKISHFCRTFFISSWFLLTVSSYGLQRSHKSCVAPHQLKGINQDRGIKEFQKHQQNHNHKQIENMEHHNDITKNRMFFQNQNKKKFTRKDAKRTTEILKKPQEYLLIFLVFRWMGQSVQTEALFQKKNKNKSCNTMWQNVSWSNENNLKRYNIS